jgi:3-dehydroquinate synthase
LARERERYYHEVADFVIDTGRPNVQSLVQSIIAKLDAAAKKAAGESTSNPTAP